MPTDWASFLRTYIPKAEFPEDVAAVEVCRLALKASALGTYGVGALLLDKRGRVIVRGHNQVFGEGFHSDLHAEMVVANRFEKMAAGGRKPGDCTLVTSLESCPMCMTRLIFAGIGTVLHLREDNLGGMVHRMKSMPPIFRTITKKQGQVWRSAKCSPELREAAYHLWDETREAVDRRVVERSKRSRP